MCVIERVNTKRAFVDRRTYVTAISPSSSETRNIPIFSFAAPSPLDQIPRPRAHRARAQHQEEGSAACRVAKVAALRDAGREEGSCDQALGRQGQTLGPKDGEGEGQSKGRR